VLCAFEGILESPNDAVSDGYLNGSSLAFALHFVGLSTVSRLSALSFEFFSSFSFDITFSDKI
jgi:hypothetical protein